jgi:hypothetical protein
VKSAGVGVLSIIKLEMAIFKWLRIQETDLYGGEIFQFVPGWDRRIKVLRNYAEK